MSKFSYIIEIACEQGPDDKRFVVDLDLNGNETLDEAVERFKDAIVCAKHAFADRLGWPITNCGRISGEPTTDEAKQYYEALRMIEAPNDRP